MDNNSESQADDSFMTCKDSMQTPRYKLRMTSTRSSILAGATPFKEPGGSSAHRSGRRLKNDTTIGSNDTFIMREQELMFDRDSLEVSANNRFSSTPKPAHPNLSPPKEKPVEEEQAGSVTQDCEQQSARSLHDHQLDPASQNDEATAAAVATSSITTSKSELLAQAAPIPSEPQLSMSRLSLSKQPTFLKEKGANQSLDTNVTTRSRNPNSSASIRSKHSPSKKSVSKKRSPSKKGKMPPPPPPPSTNARSVRSNVAESIRKRFVTPKQVFRKPINLMGTASRYLSQWNNSRLTRTQSYKSTAELERDYFKSLRSF